MTCDDTSFYFHLQDHCQTSSQYPPLMCFICKDYGRHKTHKHALVEIEAENLRTYVKQASSNVQHLIEEITESVNTVGEYATLVVEQKH